MKTICFTVYGTPRPQGSMRAFFKQGMKRPILTSDNTKLKPWRQEVSGAAAALGEVPFSAHVPLSVDLHFYFIRPKSATLKKRPGMTTKPDIDKLQRSIFDALKGILIHDDSDIVTVTATKDYGPYEGVVITIRPWATEV